MKVANVILIDDDLFVRTSLTAGLKNYNVDVIASVDNFVSARSAIESKGAEVAVVDLDLGPGPNGIDICHSLRKYFPEIGLILLTSYTDPKIADPYAKSLPKGCRFLSKSKLAEFETLVNEILIARNKPLASISISRSKQILTETQLEVLRLVAEGLSSQEIAERRQVSVKAVEGIISKIHIALNLEKSKSLNQRVQLAREYFQMSGKKPPGA
ncbi:MAG: hypothetical protein RL129_1118 [Actinomycetota bacterium]